MKILVVTPYFFPQIGGLESYVYFVSKGLLKSKNEIIIVTSNNKNDADKVEEIEGMKVYRLRTLFTLSNTPINPLWLVKIGDIIKLEKPDVISAHSPVPFIADVASVASYLSSVPFVLTYHAGSFKKNQFVADLVTSVYSNTFEKALFANSKKIIALNEFVRDTTLSKSKEKAILILPGVTLSAKKRTLKTYNSSRKKLLFVAKLDRTHSWKGLSYLLSALKLIEEEEKDVYLTVVGGGNQLDEYKKMCRELGIDKYVKFVGKVLNSEVDTYYRKNDIFILPSYSNAESLGLVLLEAMTFGMPIVATKVGGIPFTIKQDVNGMLVNPEDPESLADGILRLIREKRLFEKTGKNNFEKAKLYDWGLHVGVLNKLFKDIVNANKK